MFSNVWNKTWTWQSSHPRTLGQHLGLELSDRNCVHGALRIDCDDSVTQSSLINPCKILNVSSWRYKEWLIGGAGRQLSDRVLAEHVWGPGLISDTSSGSFRMFCFFIKKSTVRNTFCLRLLLLVFWSNILLCSPGWPQTFNLLASTSQVQGL